MNRYLDRSTRRAHVRYGRSEDSLMTWNGFIVIEGVIDTFLLTFYINCGIMEG